MENREEEQRISPLEPVALEGKSDHEHSKDAARAAGLTAPLHDEPMSMGGTAEEKGKTAEEHEKHTEDKISELRLKIEEIVALAGNDVPPEIAAARSELMGANPKDIDPQKLQQISQTVNDESAKQNLKVVTGAAGMILPIAALSAIVSAGRAMANRDVETDGQHLPDEALFTPAVDNGVDAPMPKRQIGEGMSITQ